MMIVCSKLAWRQIGVGSCALLVATPHALLEVSSGLGESFTFQLLKGKHLHFNYVGKIIHISIILGNENYYTNANYY